MSGTTEKYGSGWRYRAQVGVDPGTGKRRWLTKGGFPSEREARKALNRVLVDADDGTLALEAGVHPKVVSERLGHATVRITLDLYSHVSPALDEAAAEAIWRGSRCRVNAAHRSVRQSVWQPVRRLAQRLHRAAPGEPGLPRATTWAHAGIAKWNEGEPVLVASSPASGQVVGGAPTDPEDLSRFVDRKHVAEIVQRPGAPGKTLGVVPERSKVVMMCSFGGVSMST